MTDDCRLAGILDFNGKMGFRFGKKQLQPYLAIYMDDPGKLHWLRMLEPSFSQPAFVSRNTYMSQIISISGVQNLLNRTLDKLEILHPVAEKVMRFCDLRLKHPNEKYTLGELQLVQEIVRMTSRPAAVERRLRVLKEWK